MRGGGGGRGGEAQQHREPPRMERPGTARYRPVLTEPPRPAEPPKDPETEKPLQTVRRQHFVRHHVQRPPAAGERNRNRTAPGNGTGKRHRASAGVGSGNGEMAPGTRTGRRHRETGTETGRYREPEPGVGYRRASPAPGAPLGTSGSSVPPPTGAAEHQKDPLPPHTQPVPEVGTDPPLSGTAAAAAPHRSAGNAASERTGSGTAARGGQ